MANLVAQNIGTNYKGILNLDPTTINTPLDTTLRLVTDGMGNSSIFQLSTEQVGISRTVALSAGATNPRLFNEVYTINNSGAQTGTLTGIFLNATETALNGMTHNLLDLQVGGVSKFKVNNILDTSYTFNSDTNRYNLFSISRVGGGGAPCLYFGSGSGPTGTQGRISCNGDNLALGTVTGTTFTERLIIMTSGLIGLGGTTNLFPAIKRNGAAIDFRLADDSALCNISAQNGIFTQVGTSNSAYRIDFSTSLASGNYYQSFARHSFNTYDGSSYSEFLRIEGSGSTAIRSLLIGTTTIINTAILNLTSTTQGFLPPRMTTAQKNAIATPATGLVVFDTTLAKLAVYTGAGWETVTSI